MPLNPDRTHLARSRLGRGLLPLGALLVAAALAGCETREVNSRVYRAGDGFSTPQFNVIEDQSPGHGRTPDPAEAQPQQLRPTPTDGDSRRDYVDMPDPLKAMEPWIR